MLLVLSDSDDLLVLIQPVGYMWTSSGIVTSVECSHFHSFEVHSSIDSSKMIGKFSEALNSNRLILELHRFICKQLSTARSSWT